MGVSKTTASSVVRDVSFSIAKLRPMSVEMPETEAEIRTIRSQFNLFAKFSRAIGPIDCTRVEINIVNLLSTAGVFQ